MPGSEIAAYVAAGAAVVLIVWGALLALMRASRKRGESEARTEVLTETADERERRHLRGEKWDAGGGLGRRARKVLDEHKRSGK